MANPTTYFGWVMPTSSSLVTNLPADFNTFGQGVDTSLQYLLGGTTGQVLSKTSGTNMAFTWVTPTDQTPLTTKGDLFTFTTVDARLAVGTNGYGLIADSTAATGLAWKQEGLTLVTSTAFSGATSVAVDNCFTSTYSNYVIEIVTTSGSGGAAEIQMRFRTGGTANSGSSYYNSGAAYTYAAAADTAAQNPGTYAFALRTAGSEWCGRLDIFNPQATQKTWWLGQYADTAQNGYRGGYFNNTTSFDGIQFVNSGATNIAGTIRIYGTAN